MRQDKTPPVRRVGRPPKHGEAGTTRERLLQAGFEIASAGGMRAVTVAALADRTGANAGSFVYHFGTREAYLEELVERWYTPFMAGLQQVDAALPNEPLSRLRELLTALVLWAVHHGPFMANLLADAASGEVVAQRFLASVPGRHPALILRAVGDCQAAGLIEAGPPLTLTLFLMSATALPAVFVAGLHRSGLLEEGAMQALRDTADETASLQRLTWALRAVTLPGPAPASSRRGRAPRSQTEG